MNKETVTFDDSWLDKMIEKVESLSDEERDGIYWMTKKIKQKREKNSSKR